MSKQLLYMILLLLAISSVSATDYIRTNRTDFSVFVDNSAELDGYVYATVKINISAYPAEEFKCVDMIFYFKNDSTGELVHVQSNPPHSPQNRVMIFSNPADSPETLGYFPMYNGVGNIYFRSKDVTPYNNFTLVVLCNSNNTQLVYEKNMNPVWKEAFKSLPSRGVWFVDNASMLMVVGVFFLLVLMFIFFKFAR